MSNQVPIALNEMAKLKLLPRPYFEFSLGWFTMKISNVQTSSHLYCGHSESQSVLRQKPRLFLWFMELRRWSLLRSLPFSARLALVSKMILTTASMMQKPSKREDGIQKKKKWLSYQNQISRAYDKKVRPRILEAGDLALKVAGHVQKVLSASKFAPNCEGPILFVKPTLAVIILSIGLIQKVTWHQLMEMA